MNEKPQSHWRKPLTGRRKWFAWLALFAVVLFVVVFFIGLVSDSRCGVGGLILYASPVAVVGAVLVLLLIRSVRWLCCWRNFRRFLLGVVCLITMVALAITEENLRGKRAWKTFKREWEAKGERFDLTNFVPPPVPDDQNFAMTPLLKPLFDYTHVNGKIVWRDTNILARLGEVRADLNPLHATKKGFPLGSVEKGTFADLAACREFYRGNTNYPQPVKAGTAAEDVLVALGKFDPEMKELREAADARPRSRFPIHYEYEPPSDILLPHLAQMKGLARLFQIQAIAQMEAGQSRQAFKELKVGFRLADSIRDEPFLIDHLVRIATLMVEVQTMREGLLRHAWSDGQLVELEKHLASVDLLAEFKLTMRGERALNIVGLDYLRRRGYNVNDRANADGTRGVGMMKQRLNLMLGGFYYQNMLTIARMYQDFTIPVVDEQAHRVFPEFSDRADEALTTLSQERYKPYKMFAAMLFPALNRAIMKSARMQTYVDAARVACVLERYRLVDGKLPETLDVLTPRFIENIPTDVIDGKPLRYRLKPDGGYVLYSIGWNKTDDGGELGWTKSKNPGVDITQGDWVWQMPNR